MWLTWLLISCWQTTTSRRHESMQRQRSSSSHSMEWSCYCNAFYILLCALFLSIYFDNLCWERLKSLSQKVHNYTTKKYIKYKCTTIITIGLFFVFLFAYCGVEFMTRTTISVNVRISTDGDVDGDVHRMQRSRNGKETAAATTITKKEEKIGK